MSSKSCASTEEKFPLLLLFLEDGQRSAKQHKRILFDKGRYQGIASGANNIMTHWSGHVASGWITAMLIGIGLFAIAILMITFSIHPVIENLTAKCERQYREIKNDSSIIHLVHGPNRWTPAQLEALDQIAKNSQQFQIELILIRPEIDPPSNIVKRDVMKARNVTYPKHESTSSPRALVKKVISSTAREVVNPKLKVYEKPRKALEPSFNMAKKNLLAMLGMKKRSKKTTSKPVVLQRKARTLEDIIDAYPNILVITTTFEKVFSHTPLYFTWQNTNLETRLFAIRVLQLWNFAGISLTLPSDLHSPPKAGNTVTITRKALLEDLPSGLVTVDDEGSHMQTKSTCHAFFGELLMVLAKATPATKPADVIRKTLHKFCLKGAVDGNYCDTITK
ncbi:hypothetical protein PPYR_12922 [Photinus pyralis]|uniref:Uncharacterized protein n=1 Tax=Photinus pyralis TaxID=7054 RepID=A0A1Y1L210_PHOPY|nr:hypothetical protein PPYR_12922 [Photinus pyralis]